jgi:hypothetical protein
LKYSPRPLEASLDRRTFICGAGALLLRTKGIFAQATATAASSRPDVAVIDHDRILAASGRYLEFQPTPLVSLPCDRSPASAHDYYSEAPGSDSDTGSGTELFLAHRDALFQLGLAIPALAAGYSLTSEDRYAEQAARHLSAWFMDPATRMNPALNFAQVPAPAAPRRPNSPAQGGSYEGLVEALPLAEIAQSIPFLAASPALTDTTLSAVHDWFAAYLKWMTAEESAGPRLPALARDSHDHHGTSWMMQVCAFATLTAGDSTSPRAENSTLTGLRHRFRTSLLRSQLSPGGMFPHELTSQFAYRDSLFNLDMLATICQLLSSRFDSVWDFELQDGPGMRTAIAFHYPFIADRKLWPYRADRQHFDELPARRPSLLFCARAYQRPEYAGTWKNLPPDPTSADILRTIPLHQPLLWVRQPPRRIVS